MFDQIFNEIQIWLGLGQEIKDVGAFQMAIRTIVIYVFSLAIIRLGSKRFLSQASAFDVIVGRLHNDHTDPARIKLAYLERNGRISVIPIKREPRVVEIGVKDGVQIVRIELGQ